MKRLIFIFTVIFLSLASLVAQPVIDPELEAEMQRIGNEEKTKVVILLSEQSDAMALLREAKYFDSRQEQRQFVIETLKRQAETTQYELIGLLNEMERNSMVDEIQQFWLVNCISCKANKAAINDLAQHRDIMTIYHCKKPNGFLKMRPRLPQEAMDAKSPKTYCKSMRRRCGNKAIRAQVF